MKVRALFYLKSISDSDSAYPTEPVFKLGDTLFGTDEQQKQSDSAEYAGDCHTGDIRVPIPQSAPNRINKYGNRHNVPYDHYDGKGNRFAGGITDNNFSILASGNPDVKHIDIISVPVADIFDMVHEPQLPATVSGGKAIAAGVFAAEVHKFQWLY